MSVALIAVDPHHISFAGGGVVAPATTGWTRSLSKPQTISRGLITQPTQQ